MKLLFPIESIIESIINSNNRVCCIL